MRLKTTFFLVVPLLASIGWLWQQRPDHTPVKIGIIHSLTGTMATSEKPLVNALLLAVKQINQQGGVLGHPIQTIVVDGRSDWQHSAAEAERLITEEQVSALFGCWTSACRQAVKPVVEKHQHLLFYPLQYEGMEQSTHIVYTGAAPNQQIIPSIAWAIQNLGKSFFLLGSDYIFPRVANLIIKDLVKAQQGTVVAEHYRPLGDDDFQSIIEDIRRTHPAVILNTLNGDSNLAFFKALAALPAIPVISYSVGESELASIGQVGWRQHYAVWNYFQSINRIENHRFIQQYQQQFGQQPISDPMEASYIGVKLWAEAVKHAGAFEPQRVLNVIGQQSINAPEGIVTVDKVSHHLWKTIRIGQVQSNGQFKVLWQSEKLVRPVPYPSFHSRKTWQQRIQQLMDKPL